MSTLVLTLLGNFQVTHAGQPLTAWQTDKVRALLAYLAVESERSHRRADLAQLLWPGYGEESARTNLRQALLSLRQVLGDASADPVYLQIARQTLQINPIAVDVDVNRFTRLLNECDSHTHHSLAQCQECLTRLQQAATLYQGDFLAGFALDDSAAFEEWRRVMQEQYHIRALDLLGQLAGIAEAAGDDEQTHVYALRQLTLEPWLETAHRKVMHSLARRGQRAAAIAQYNTCRQVLAEELGAEPDAETVALVEQIRSGLFRKQTADELPGDKSPIDKAPVDKAPVDTLIPIPSAHYDWGEMPAVDIFKGRTVEMEQLQTWLAPKPGSNCAPARLVSLLAIGGMGKTTLAAAVSKAVAARFDFVIWRSLINAPPLTETLHNWLQLLSRQSLTHLPESQDEQLRLLLDYLRQHRCLLVLDNFESILLANQEGKLRAGEMRPGYAGYADLLQRIATVEHQSALLLTSREQPYVLTRFGPNTHNLLGRVHSLLLPGLDEQAAQALLHVQGLQVSSQEVAQLVKHYSGNPLALQIIGNTIVDFFGGDVAAFYNEEGFLFDGIRLVLDQQFARLSPLEKELLIWLAIERDAVSVAILRSNLLHAPPISEVLNALQSLQARSLLEKTNDGFTLQNVIIEYTTEHLVQAICHELSEETGFGWQDDKVSLQQPLRLTYLNRFALIKAQSKEYVRQSQERLILHPVALKLAADWGERALRSLVQPLLVGLRGSERRGGYAPGNLLNLLLHLGYDLEGYDFSQLAIRQAYLRGKSLSNVNFAYSDLTTSVFTDAFHNVHAVAFHPNGEQMMIGMGDGTIRVWSRTGELLDVWHGNGKAVWLLAFHPKGELLATDGAKWGINLWDVTQKQVVGILTGHTTIIHEIAFSADGRLLAACGNDGTVRVWDVASGAAVHLLTGHNVSAECVAFSRDGRWLASGGQDNAICLWDLASGTRVRSLTGHSRTVRRVLFCPEQEDGKLRLISASWDQTMRVWDGETGETIHLLHGHTGEITALGLSKDGRFATSTGNDSIARVWNVQTGEVQQMLTGHVGWIADAALSPDDQQLATVGFDQTIRLWDLRQSDGRAHLCLHGYHRPAGVLHFDTAANPAANPNHDRAAMPALKLVNYNLAAYTWDLASQRLIHSQKGPTTIQDDFAPLAISPDGLQVACHDEGHGIQIWSAASGQVTLTLPGHSESVTALAFHPNGKILASGGWDKQIRLWQIGPAHQGSRLLATLSAHSNKVSTLAFSPDGSFLASAGRDPFIYIWRVDSGQLLATLTGHKAAVLSLAFAQVSATPEDEPGTLSKLVLVSGGIDRTVRIWRLSLSANAITAAAPLLCSRPDQSDSISWVAISPDGQRAASASWDNTVTLWETEQGSMVYDLVGHVESVRYLAFSPDSQWLASSSHDESVRLWNVQRGICVMTLCPPGPYAGMNITGVTGISEAQRSALKVLSLLEESVSAEPEPRSAHLVVHNLPTYTAALVGREAEIGKLLELLQQPATRLVTVVGAGGIGKTRLAQQVARSLLTTFGDGVFLVRLETINSVEAVVAEIAAVIGLPLKGKQPLQELVHFLCGKQMLLLLDNFEHLLPAADVVAAILQATEPLKIIITSRQRLTLPDEHLFVLDGLSYPAHNEPEQALPSTAVQLFIECGRRVQPNLQVNAATHAAVVRICQLVQGMPLALELAAAWLEVLSASEIADEIARTADFLTNDWLRALPTRQQSMRAIFAGSWQLLNENERQIFRRLAVFRGSFTRQAAEKVTGASMRTIAGLVHKSLLYVVDSGALTSRYQVQELPRQFATEELVAAGEEAEIALRHSQFYLTYVAERATSSQDASSSVTTDLQRDLDNIRHAWLWASDHQCYSLLMQSVYILANFFYVSGFAVQGLQLFRHTTQALQRVRDVTFSAQADRSAQADQKIQPKIYPEYEFLLSSLYACKADFLVALEQYEEGVQFAQQGKALGQRSGNHRGESLCCFLLAKVLVIHRKDEQAETGLLSTLALVHVYQKSSTVEDELADIGLSAILWLGHLAMLHGEFRKAQAHFNEGLYLARAKNRRRAEVSFLLNLAGLTVYGFGDFVTARRHYSLALQIASDIGYRWAEASALLELGDTLRLLGEYSTALDLFQRAQFMFERIHHPMKATYSRLSSGRLYAYCGAQEQATSVLAPLADLLNDALEKRVVDNILLALATNKYLLNQYSEAIDYCNQGLQVLDEGDHLTLRIGFLTLLGHSQSQLQWDEAAATSYQQVLTLNTTAEYSASIVEAHAGLAILCLRRTDHAAALQHTETVFSILQQFPHAGYDEPFFAYLTAYQVLSTLGDGRANEILLKGYQLLSDYASHIADESLRRCFLENVATHRQLCQAYAELLSHAPTTLPMPIPLNLQAALL